MKIGDKITLDGFEWSVRKFSAAEHQLFEEISEAHGLEDLEAKAQAAAAGERAPGKREQLIKMEIDAVSEELGKYISASGDKLKPGLDEEDRAKAYELALKIDLLEQRIADVRAEAQAHVIRLREKSVRAQQAAMAEYMHHILSEAGYQGSLEDLRLSLGPEDYEKLEQVVMLGKLRLPLSGLLTRLERESQTSLARALKMIQGLEEALPSGGTRSGSKRSHPASQRRSGKKGR